jgi:hypothetical protein
MRFIELTIITGTYDPTTRTASDLKHIPQTFNASTISRIEDAAARYPGVDDVQTDIYFMDGRRLHAAETKAQIDEMLSTRKSSVSREAGLL